MSHDFDAAKWFEGRHISFVWGGGVCARSCRANVAYPPLRSPHLWAMFRKPQHLLVSDKVRQYTSNLYGSTPPHLYGSTPPHLYGSTFLPSKLPRKGNPAIRLPFVLQYASHLYGNTPPICTAVRLPFVRQYASHLHGSTFGRILGVGATGTFLKSA